MNVRERRARLIVPFLLSVTLFCVYWFFRFHPLHVAGLGDVRESVFGKDLRWLLFLAVVPVVFFIVRLLDLLAFDVFITRRRHVNAPTILREILSIVLYFVLFAWAMSEILNRSVTGWLATGTVVAAVLGLALQETLGNLFAGIALHLEDSFEVGDVIRSGDFTGVVEAVRWRGTRIRTFNNDFVIVPNSMLARERLEVFPRGNLNARVVQVGIDYHIPPAKVIGILVQAAANVEGVAREIPCIARVGGFGESAVMYDIKYYMHDYALRDRIDSEIRKAVWYALRRNGISIPYPISSYFPYTAPLAQDHLSSDDVLARLHEVDILAPVPDDDRQTIAAAARVHDYSKGETILRHGSAGDSMFVIHSGSVAIRVPDEQGGRRDVAQLGPGSVFGEMALLTGEARTADVVATSDTMAIEIAKNALQPILIDHPELASAISAKILERRETLDHLRAGSHEEAQRTILSRMRAFFGL